MRRRLPSLNALKAFEASARQESLTKAAQEFFVTRGAREICGMAEATSLNTPWACASTIAMPRAPPPDFCMAGALVSGQRPDPDLARFFRHGDAPGTEAISCCHPRCGTKVIKLRASGPILSAAPILRNGCSATRMSANGMVRPCSCPSRA